MNPKIIVALPILALLGGCVFDSSSKSTSTGGSSSGKVFVLGSQYTSATDNIAALDRIDTVSHLVANWPTSDVDLDSAAGVLYAIQRTNGVVTGYQGGDVGQVTLEVNVGSDANPYAVASLSGKLWVACYGSSFLKAVDPASQKVVDSIDLSAYADTKDGQKVPQALAIHPWNGDLAVVLGRLDYPNPGDSSLVLVLDPASKTVLKRIALPWKNAYAADWNGSHVLVGCVGSWGVLDGAVVEVDLSAGTSKTMVTENALGGDAEMVAFGPSGEAFVGVSDTSTYDVSVRTLNLSSGTLGPKLSGTIDVGALSWDGSDLWLGSASASTPEVIRTTASGSPVDTVKTTLSPSSILVLP
jgi:hypothetical protein